MFDFYKMSYDLGYLDMKIMKEATKWNVITKEEFKTITII
ncbi:XkdX family protein [Clostridium botulinum C]|nr:XkdX family protein [Clostridium botulinum]MCD3245342.1 XkdX family protein [Clostridium botulinum C]MCD3261721.1 XkdX family protein [Clostridium botulinum C]